MNLIDDVITYIRRLVKSTSNDVLSTNLIIDYINRFYTCDMDARIQLFDLKTNYTFSTIPGNAAYNMPLYTMQTEGSNPSSNISYYPVYQGFSLPAFVNGIQVPFYTEPNAFWNLWPNYVQYLNPSAYGNGTAGPYTINLAEFPAIPGHLDMTGVIAAGNTSDPIFSTTIPANIPFSSFYPGVWFTATDETGNNMTVQDSGIFLSTGTTSQLYGLLMTQNTSATGYAPGNPYNYQVYGSYSTTLNTVDYANGVAYVTFPNIVPDGAAINAQSLFFQPGLPRAILFNNNQITIRPPP